uniref:Integrin beta n=1 Tax=Gadus morhua TaxID=8049 RepID=A0A8C5F3K9_GADMO
VHHPFQGFLQAGEPSERRCDAKEALTSRGCKEPYPPETDETLLMKDKELSASDDIIQLRPQQIDFQLRVGEYVPQTFKVSFKRAEGYPIDLYYLMDLSFSMGDDLDMIKKLSQDMVSTLQSFTKKLRIGFGSFVDKVALPYVSEMKKKRRDPSPHRGTSCQPAFSFQNLLNLTTDTAAFENKVIGQMISANLDSPESGFDAIMQAAVCKEVIGWDDGTKILVYTSDDTFHMAGDGRLAGLREPPDGNCHLSPSGLYDGTRFDYPSIGQLARVLTANNIQLIFAVTKNISAAYEELSKMIPQSVVGVLESDSSNVVQLIKNAYNSLSSSVVLEHHGAPQGLEVAYQAHCTSPSPGPPGLRPWSQRAECKDIKINQQVDFYVQLNMSRCLEQTEFHLSVQGISEQLKVVVRMKCECDCGPVEEASPSCSGHGTLHCGTCSCDPGFLGQACDCQQSEDHVSLDEKCRHGGSSQLCSGHGSCECGKCACQRSFSGQFCECDDSNCAKSNQQLCGGNGKCVCGKCNCSGAYGGEACDCSTHTDRCQTAGRPCSGSGECLCNRCVCKGGFDGDHFLVPLLVCRKCVTCLSKHKKEEVAEACGVPCEGAVLSHKKTLRDAYCSFQSFLYDVTLTPQGIVHLRYAEMPSSIDKTWVIIGSSVSGILFIGLLIIVISRLLLELSYRREYQSFVASQQQTNWKETRNPLFKGATTTVMNPLCSLTPYTLQHFQTIHCFDIYIFIYMIFLYYILFYI